VGAVERSDCVTKHDQSRVTCMYVCIQACIGITCGCKGRLTPLQYLFYIRILLGLLNRRGANRKIEMFLNDLLSGVITGKN